MKTIDQTIKVKQGEDLIVEVPILTDAGGAVDLEDATEIRAYLLVNNVMQAKYSLANISGYGNILVGGTENNVVRLLVTRTESKNFQLGSLKVAVRVSLPEADLGTERKEVEASLGSVIAGYLKDES